MLIRVAFAKRKVKKYIYIRKRKTMVVEIISHEIA